MRCFLYARKSTEEKERQIQSIPDQVRVLKELAIQRGLEIVDIITDERTARMPGRQGFNALMRRLEDKEAQSILCWKIDRLTRNSLDSGELQFKLQQGKIQQIITPEKTHYPDDNTLLLLLECGMATQYSRDLSRNVKRGMQSKVEKGWLPCEAPIGYLNEKLALKGQKRILPDPALFPIIQSLWKKLLTDQCSTMQLFRHMQQHCPMYRNGKIMAFSTFCRIFRNKFYCGLFLWRGEWHLGAHEPMISQAVFADAQKFLERGKGTRERTLEFPLKGLFRCGTCDAFITAERKTKLVKTLGKTQDYDYYRCGHRKRNIRCSEKPLSAPTVLDQIAAEIDLLSIPDEIIRFGIETLDQMEASTEESIKEKQLREHYANLSQKVAAIEKYIAEEPDTETRAIMKRRLNQLRIEQKATEEDLLKAKAEGATRYAEIRSRLDLILHAKHVLYHGSPDQQRSVVRGLGSNWKLRGKKLDYEPHFVSLALKEAKHTFAKELAMLEPKKSLVETAQSLRCELVSTIWSGIRESNPRLKLGKLAYYHCTNPARKTGRRILGPALNFHRSPAYGHMVFPEQCSYTDDMTTSEEQALLIEIRDALKSQQKMLEEIRASRPSGRVTGTSHWKFMIILAGVVLIAGCVGAYQYYRILQSIISQFPQ